MKNTNTDIKKIAEIKQFSDRQLREQVIFEIMSIGDSLNSLNKTLERVVRRLSKD